MGGLANFAMRGRSQAIGTASALGALALIVPLLSILSSALVALVTLRHGPKEGLLVGAVSALVTGLAAFLFLGSPPAVIALLLMLTLPIWLLGVALRNTRSLDLVVQLALGFGLVLIAALYLQLGDPQAQWDEILGAVAEGFVQSEMMDASQGEAFVQTMAPWMNGILAAGFYLQLLLALLLARSWQAQLYNPGGFRAEFHALRAGRMTGLAAVALLGLTLLLGANAPALVRDLGLLLATLFFLQGLAVAHGVVARAGMHVGWLVALYVLLFIAMAYAVILVALIGLADVFADFRGKTKVGQPPP